MGQLAIITAANNATGHRIEFNTKSLDITVDVIEPDNYATAALFIAALVNIELEVNKQTKSGTVSVLKKMKLLDLFELCQANGGLLIVNAAAAGRMTIRGRVELSDMGAIPLVDGEFFEVNFPTVSLVGDGDETLAITVNSLDDPNISNQHNIYQPIYCNAGVERIIDIKGAKVLGIPTADADLIELLYANGRWVKYSKSELIALQDDRYMIRSFIQASAQTSGINQLNRLILVDIAKAVAAKITVANAANVFLIKYENLAVK